MALYEDYDVVLFDLDGVIYRGPEAVPGAVETLALLRAKGRAVGFVTNNASRTPAQVAEHLRELGIEAGEGDVVTSAQAIAALMARELAPGSVVFVLGAEALAREVELVGLTPTSSPQGGAIALVQGYDPQMTWPRLQDGIQVLHGGARWYASNNDLTIPSERGLMPGLGSVINMIAGVVGGYPSVAGKPERPLLEQTIQRLGSGKYLFVGDRLDTDIQGANRVGMDSLFVLSGVHTRQDLEQAPTEQLPTYIGDDVTALTRECARLEHSDPASGAKEHPLA